MAYDVNTSGSQTTSGTTEHDLATLTSANAFMLSIDVSDMVGGTTPDILEIAIYGKARSSDTERLIKKYVLTGAQVETLFQTPVFVSPHHIRISVKAAAGTITLPWAIYEMQ